jgi:lipoprotein-anchoring transpeptidase ErfK/SrfK
MTLRPRYARISALSVSAAVTAVALLGSSGALPSSSPASSPTPTTAAAPGSQGTAAIALSAFARPPAQLVEREPSAPVADVAPATQPDDELPARSGQGKRVVFDMSAQRVWLVGEDEEVRRTYLVSGSLTDNLEQGRYEVYSTSRHAIGIDDSGTMQYMVRFAHGERAAIGFHDIPVKDGERLQTRAELGTPRSHGCIRQARADARALWSFAGLGTPVVVTA